MTDPSGWSPAGIVSLVAIAAGIVLLVVYAVRRGMFIRELDGTDEEAALGAADDPTAVRTPASATSAAPAAATARRANAGRPLGILGATLLVVGLALGIMVATGTWGGSGTTPPSGTSGQDDCAAGWDGCPKATPQP
jgi:hypothetical protein